MSYASLTPNAEKLLQEIIDTQLKNGNSNPDYWAERFCELNHAERMQLKSTFKELSDIEMIKVFWADSFPYSIVLLNYGVSYFELKQAEEEKEKKERRSNIQHDALMAFLGALFAGIVGVVLFFFFGIGG